MIAIFIATRKLTNERVELLRKAEEGKDEAEAESHRVPKEREGMEASKKKAQEETEWLRQELQELWAGFVVQKEELEVVYQKQVDDMFFYGYRCCMKKHGIT